ncbi:exo-alpha-sialidase [Streptomyces sp. CB02400]|uniref:exo-alpha-sialidase n=1 Tax=Streptomyces sp. CB02400 TaxID=1703944 RepID=UPI00093C4024|nr:exo-alpha-sialidase [Streptomyces sp. CB02400]
MSDDTAAGDGEKRRLANEKRRPAEVGTLLTAVLAVLAVLWGGAALGTDSRATPLETVPVGAVPGGHGTVFASGESGYSCFRAPAVVRAGSGKLLAFAEARNDDCGDSGRIDLVLKHSTDGGATWSPLTVVTASRQDASGLAFPHNATPIVNTGNGDVVLLYTESYRRVHVRTSTDDGLSWGAARDITSAVWKPEWGALGEGQLGVGPSHGIMLTRGAHAGRLVAGMGYRIAPGRHLQDPKGGALIHSDDGGRTWQSGASSHGAEPELGVQELSVFERADGSLVAVARNEEGTDTVRAAYAVSRDQGLTFEADFAPLDPLQLPRMGVQASTLAVRAEDRDGYDRVLLAAPADTDERRGLTIRSSFDGGLTWQTPAQGALVTDGISAYSDMVDLTGGRYGILYEGGTTAQHQFIRWAGFTEADLDRPDDAGTLTAGQYTGALPTGSPDQLHLFAPTPTGGLGHWFEEADGTVKRGTWGTGVAGEAVAFPYGTQQHALVRGTDGSLQHRFWDTAAKAVVQETWLPAGTVAGAPTALVTPGQQHAFVRAVDGRLLHSFWDEGSGELRRQTWAAPGSLAGDPVAVVYGTQQHVWAAGTDGALHHWWWTKGPGVRHESWGGTVRGTPTAFVHEGQQHVFAGDADGRLAHWSREAAAQVVERETWSTPEPLGGRPVAFVHGSQRHVFARTANDTLAHWWWDPSYSVRYAVLPGTVRSDPVAHVVGDVQHVYGAAADGTLEHWWWERTEGNRRESWGGRVAATPPW